MPARRLPHRISQREFTPTGLFARGLSRRGFLAAGTTGLAGASLSACQNGGAPGKDAPPPTPVGVGDDEWAEVRARFILEPGVAYMNNAGLGVPPVSVARAVGTGCEALSREPLQAKEDLGEVIAGRVIPGLAAFLGALPGELVLTRNASEALHMGAVGVRLEPGDEVLITSQEHPAGRRPWEYRAKHHGVKVNTVFIPSPFRSGEEVIELVEAALTPATRVLAFCHVTRGGHLYPVRRLCALARERRVVSHVDGAQAVGMFPVDLHDLGCDTYAASLHKWMLGPMGTGFLYVRADSRDRVRSAYAPEEGTDISAYQPPGTVPLPTRAALSASLQFMEAVGIGNVAARTRHLSDHLKTRLATRPGATLLSGATPATSCPGSTIFELKGVDAMAAVPLVRDRARIHIDEHQRDGHNAIRISTHVYNTVAEVERVVGVLGEMG